MIKRDVPLSNDQVDKHGDRMTLGDLKDARDQTNSKVMISHNQHDFRSPPIGRIEKAYIRNIDGINWLLGEFRLFTMDDINHENRLRGRELAIYDLKEGTVSIICDRSYVINNLVQDAEQLQQAFDSSQEIKYENKKSFEPISTLTVLVGMGATFAISQFFGGLFSEAGKDSWGLLKKIIKKNQSIKHNEEKQYQFIFNFMNDYYKTELMLIFTDPDPDNFEKIIKANQDKIEQKIISYYEQSIRVKRIVYTHDKGELNHAYSVYRCGTPFDISNISEFQKLLESKAK
ncbi:hypothetical protein [Aeromonas veronii]|uniref:hypothetical protein n=1 Tax=Aeromonas veronii TaxID=654 RepID=UPI003D1AFCDE